jgi:hypothetical protein
MRRSPGEFLNQPMPIMRLSLRRRRPPLDPVYADSRPVLRTYLYVDSDQVLNALSSFQGGRIDEVRRTIVREGGANISAKVPVWLAQIEAGAQGTRRIEDQIVIKPMFESALTMLLDPSLISGASRGAMTSRISGRAN